MADKSRKISFTGFAAFGAAFIVSGCSKPFYLTKSGRQLIPLEATSCCVIRMDELNRLNELHYPTSYIGTKDHHDIIQWWTKVSPGRDACLCYAIPEGQFTPEHPYPYRGPNWWDMHHDFYRFETNYRNHAKWIAVGQIKDLSVQPIKNSSRDSYEFTLLVDKWEKGEQQALKEIRLQIYQARLDKLPIDTDGEFRVYGTFGFTIVPMHRLYLVLKIEKL